MDRMTFINISKCRAVLRSMDKSKQRWNSSMPFSSFGSSCSKDGIFILPQHGKRHKKYLSLNQFITFKHHPTDSNSHHLSPVYGVQRRSFINTKNKSMLAKVYDVESNNVSISEQEQEIIKINLSSNTGTEDTHLKLLKNLQEQVEKLSSMQEIHDDSKHQTMNDHKNEEIKTLIHQMQKVAQEYTNLGMLDDAKSLQEDILQRLIDYHRHKKDPSDNLTNKGDNNLPPQHLDIARVMHNIGSLQSRMNFPYDAKKWFDVSLQIKQSILCNTLGYEFHHEIGKSLNGLALVEIQMMEESHNAYLTVVQMLTSAEQQYLYHGEKRNKNNSNNNYENENYNGDDDDDYTKMMNSCLTAEDVYDGDSMSDHPHLISINSNMAMVYRKNSEFWFALQKYQEALRVQKLWTPTEHCEENSDENNTGNSNGNMNVIRLLMDIGDCNQALEKYDDALDNYEEALRLHMVVIRKERLKQYRGKEKLTAQDNEAKKDVNTNSYEVDNPMDDVKVSPIEGILRHNIGLMYANLGQFDDAMAEYQSSLKIKKEVDDNNPEVAKTLNAIGALEATKGEYSSAKSFFKEALSVYRMNSTAISGSIDEDSDEAIYQTKKNIELVQRQMEGFGSSRRRQW